MFSWLGRNDLLGPGLLASQVNFHPKYREFLGYLGTIGKNKKFCKKRPLSELGLVPNSQDFLTVVIVLTAYVENRF